MKKTYQLKYTKYEVIEVRDEDMILLGYEAPITDEMREEYLNNLIEEVLSNNLLSPADDMEVTEINLEEVA